MINEQPFMPWLFQGNILATIFDFGYAVFAFVYFIFSLMVIRQVYSMTDTVVTEARGLIRFIAFVHSGLALFILAVFIFYI